jgi:nucleoside-diphosphate-sugar epimerase
MRVIVFGYGPVGREITARLAARGDAVTVAQRSAPGTLPDGVSFRRADIGDAAATVAACEEAEVIVCAIGFPYRTALWLQAWPQAMANLLVAAQRAKARFVFADNLYMYGPQTVPLREDMPLTEIGGKPGVRAEITRMWQDAHRAGRVQATAVRASDFYGPNVATSVLSEFGIARLIAGKPALAPYSPDFLHDFTYVPDFARAVISLIDAPDDAYGEAWHVPNAPTRTLREHLIAAARIANVRFRISVLSDAVKPLIGLFSADIRELREMRFQTDRPYRVDHTKFAKRFWADATPFEDGLAATVSAYRRR